MGLVGRQVSHHLVLVDEAAGCAESSRCREALPGRSGKRSSEREAFVHGVHESAKRSVPTSRGVDDVLPGIAEGIHVVLAAMVEGIDPQFSAGDYHR